MQMVVRDVRSDTIIYEGDPLWYQPGHPIEINSRVYHVERVSARQVGAEQVQELHVPPVS